MALSLKQTYRSQVRGVAGAAEAPPAVHGQPVPGVHAGQAVRAEAAAGVAVPGQRGEAAAAAAPAATATAGPAEAAGACPALRNVFTPHLAECACWSGSYTWGVTPSLPSSASFDVGGNIEAAIAPAVWGRIWLGVLETVLTTKVIVCAGCAAPSGSHYHRLTSQGYTTPRGRSHCHLDRRSRQLISCGKSR